MKNLVYKDLMSYIEEAKNVLVQTPRESRLPDRFKNLTDAEFKAMCYLKASLMIWGKHKLLKEDFDDIFEFRLDTPDSDPDAEDI